MELISLKVKSKRSRRARGRISTRAGDVTVRRRDGSTSVAPAYTRRELAAVIHGRRGAGVHT